MLATARSKSFFNKLLEEMVELGRQHDSKVFLAVVPFVDQLRNDYLVRDCDYDYVVKS